MMHLRIDDAQLPPPNHPSNRPDEPPVVTSQTLLRNARELIIRHGNDSYRLRLTSTNKLILTK